MSEPKTLSRVIVAWVTFAVHDASAQPATGLRAPQAAMPEAPERAPALTQTNRGAGAPRGPRLTLLVGGSLVGKLTEHADGHPVDTPTAPALIGTTLDGQFDTQLWADWNLAHSLVLGAGGGLTFWNGDARARTGYGANRFASAMIAPGARLPPFKCRRCPQFVVRAPIGVALSTLSNSAPSVAVTRDPQRGYGFTVGARLTTLFALTDHLGLQLDVGVYHDRLHHRMRYTTSDGAVLGEESLSFYLTRPTLLVGLWVRP